MIRWTAPRPVIGSEQELTDLVRAVLGHVFHQNDDLLTGLHEVLDLGDGQATVRSAR
jgi:hypothetical protein